MEILDGIIWMATADSGIVRIAGLISSIDDEDKDQTPFVFDLKQNYPNPFNPNTNIEFTINEAENVIISIFNTNGELIKSLANQNYSAGTHTLTWNGTDKNNHKVASGVYLYRLEAGNEVLSNKMILLK
jgi:hypothetical protein